MKNLQHFIEEDPQLVLVDPFWSWTFAYASSRKPNIISGEGELPEEEGDYDIGEEIDEAKNLDFNPSESQVIHRTVTNAENIDSENPLDSEDFLGLQSQITNFDQVKATPLEDQKPNKPSSAFPDKQSKQDQEFIVIPSSENLPNPTMPQISDDLDAEALQSKITNPLEDIFSSNKNLIGISDQNQPEIKSTIKTPSEEPNKQISIGRAKEHPHILKSSKNPYTKEITLEDDESDENMSQDEEENFLQERPSKAEIAKPITSINPTLALETMLKEDISKRQQPVSKQLPDVVKPSSKAYAIDLDSSDQNILESAEQIKSYAGYGQTKKRKTKEESFHFEDESFEDDLKDPKIKEDAHFKLLDGPVDEKTKKQLQKEIYSKSQIAKIYCMVGFFILFFLVSSVLWIIIFRNLNSRNNYLAGIILHPPTLGVYYDLYVNFFKKFDYNRDKLFDIQKVINTNGNADHGVYKESFGKLNLLKDDINDHLLKIKEKLKEMQQGYHIKGRKLMGTSKEEDYNKDLISLQSSNESDDEPPVNHLFNHAEIMISKKNKIKGYVDFIKRQKPNFNFKEKNIIKNLNDLYSQSFELIDLYGEFYITTNRIWVTSDNIFRLYKKRAEQLNTEIGYNHFDRVEKKVENIKLLTIEYNSYHQIDQFAPIEIKTERPVYLICEVYAQVDNSDLQNIGHIYELSLVVDQKRKEITKSKFQYEIIGKHDVSRFVSMVKLTKPVNYLRIFARVEKGDVKLKEVNIECFKIYSFLKFPEYEK